MKRRNRRPYPYRASYVPRLEPLEGRAVPSTCVVNSLGDAGVGTAADHGDLRFCLSQSDARPGEDLIIFSVTGTINLTKALPEITDDLIIAGPGADQLTVRRDTGGPYRLFTVKAGVAAQIYSLTITNGAPGGTNKPKDYWGGGIYNSGTLTMGGVAVTGNIAALDTEIGMAGGGVYNEGSLFIYDSTIAGNTLVGGIGPTGGGGIGSLASSATLVISSSTIAGNTAQSHPYNGGIGRLCGGGVAEDGLVIRNSTVTGNQAINTGNQSLGGTGGICSSGATVQNTIASGNIAPPGYDPDFSGSISSGGYNLIGGDAKLGPLQDNGGPTQTVALLPGSPAIDAGDNTDAPEWDQRGPGYPRIVNGTIDIGSFEVQNTVGPAGGWTAAVPATGVLAAATASPDATRARARQPQYEAREDQPSQEPPDTRPAAPEVQVVAVPAAAQDTPDPLTLCW
jgi:hypothetical protein